MEASTVVEKLKGLDSYGSWVDIRAEQQTAFNDVPFDIDQNDPAQLKQKLEYLDLEAAQKAARELLKLEIASQDEGFMPVGYRLGALAALDATNRPLDTKWFDGGKRMTMRGDPFSSLRHEQRIRPSRDPLELSAQVGDELERLRRLLNTKRAVPVVMVWNHRFIPPRIDYDEVVLGNLPNPRDSFVLEEPAIVDGADGSTVNYAIPDRLHGVVKKEVIRPDEYVQPESKYKDPVITTLVRLGVAQSSFASHDPDALYIGKVDTKARIAKAEADKRSYDAQIQARRARRIARRRRPPVRFR